MCQKDMHLSYLRALISCCDDIMYWQYDMRGDDIVECESADAASADSEDPDGIYRRIFYNARCRETILRHLKDNRAPLIIGIRMGLLWAVVFEQTTDSCRLHVLGPVFDIAHSLSDIKKAIAPWEERMVTMESRAKFARAIQSLPVLSHANLIRYGLMLHYCITGEKLRMVDIHTARTSSVPANASLPLAPADRHRTYLAERQLMEKIEKGDLDYQDALNAVLVLENFEGQYRGGSIDQLRISCIIFAALCARAAIEGGITPDTAYSMRDEYIQLIQSGQSFHELQSINHNLCHDFIQRVHDSRLTETLSPEVLACREFLRLHPNEAFDLKDLAEKYGYTPYYFSRKFKKETGISLAEDIRLAKLEHAKFLLETTEDSIQEIAEQIHFSSRTHFTDTFKKTFGCSPTQWRNSRQRR